MKYFIALFIAAFLVQATFANVNGIHFLANNKHVRKKKSVINSEEYFMIYR